MCVDPRCAIITEEHIDRDKSSEYLSKKIGSTGSGCGPANSDRVLRTIGLAKDTPELEDYITDVSLEINEAIDNGEEVFIEGSQGFALSLYYGSYPYVTSKDTTASTFAADVGVGPTKVDEVINVFKAYISRVGEGPFPTEMTQEEAESKGLEEYGVVTGRRRRIGHFDMELAKESCRINGATQIALTCVDRLFDCARVQDYSELSAETKAFIDNIETETGVPVTIISTGPDLKDTIDLRKELL
jgi:adenylosuccinate synthase